jgi:DNA-directed RNA polymerase subunit K/omega
MNNLIEHSDFYTNYDISKYKTEPIMSKYEYTQVLGLRVQQIERGAEPLIKISDNLNTPELIAEEELRQRKTPFIIKRKVGKTYEYWKIEDLSIEIL